MLCNKEEFQVEFSRKIVLWQIFLGHRSEWFLLLSACHLVDYSHVSICVTNLEIVQPSMHSEQRTANVKMSG